MDSLGQGLTFFCNDAYRRNVCWGTKYPVGAGAASQPVGGESQPDVRYPESSTSCTGAASLGRGLLLFLPSGPRYTEDHTFSYSPLRDGRDAVVGMLCVVSGDTAG